MRTVTVRDLEKNVKQCVVDDSQQDLVGVASRGKTAVARVGLKGADWDAVVLPDRLSVLENGPGATEAGSFVSRGAADAAARTSLDRPANPTGPASAGATSSRATTKPLTALAHRPRSRVRKPRPPVRRRPAVSSLKLRYVQVELLQRCHDDIGNVGSPPARIVDFPSASS